MKNTSYNSAKEYFEGEIPENVRSFLKESNAPRDVRDFIVNSINELKTEEARQAQFVSDVSHEIRTPLTAIRGTAETLLEGGVPKEMERRFLTQIVNESDRLTRLANDLLTLQKAQNKHLELSRVNLRVIADNCSLLMGELLEERSITLQVRGEAPDINGNTDAINQILVNLIENASRYANKRVVVEITSLKDYSVLAIRDDGPGFGNIDPTHLFDRFYRADQSRARHRSTGNSGLGLSIVKALTEAMNGTVEAANLPHGAVFIVAFPSLKPCS